MTRESVRRAGRHLARAVLGLVLLALVAEVARLALWTPNVHTDNLYNLGLVHRSAGAAPWPLLETSYVHWYFEPYPMVRPEDWHRSAALVLLRGVAEAMGAGHDTMLRLPHLVWVLALWLLMTALARRLAPPEATRSRTRMVGLAAGVLLLLLLSGPGLQVMTGAFMDDAPAAVFALLAVLLLLRGPPSPRRSAAIGAACGLAFWMKDLALIWGGLGPLLIASVILLDRRGRVAAALVAPIAACVLGFAAVAAIKVAWNLADLGVPLATPARLGMVGRNVPGVFDGEHFVYFLFPQLDVHSGSLLAQGATALAARVSLGLRLSGYAFLDLTTTWLLVGVAVLVLRRGPRGGTVDRLLAMMAVVTAAIAGLGILHLAEPLQLRYWLVPVCLASALGAAAVATALSDCRGWLPWAVCAVLVVGLLPPAMRYRDTVASLGSLRPYSPAAAAALVEAAGEDGPVMLQANRGTQYWAQHPRARVVGVRAAPMAALDRTRMGRFLAVYPVAAALVDLSEEPALAQALVRDGFTVRRRFGTELLLEPPAATAATGEAR